MSNSQNTLNKIIGTGFSSPLVFDKEHPDRLFLMVEGLSVINQSIHTILSTAIGERYNNPNFGCDLNKRIFEPNDSVLKDTIKYDVSSALGKWEKRISVNELAVLNNDDDSRLDEHLILIIVNYTVNSTHTQGSYVFPFVLTGMPIGEIINKGI
jgi:phage baseplate assembly protein W